MIRIVRQGEDICEYITGSIELVKSMKYYTNTMSPNDAVIPEMIQENDVIKCVLSADKVARLASGQLISEIELAEEDSEYPDKEYNQIKKKHYDIYIKNDNPVKGPITEDQLDEELQGAIELAKTSIQQEQLDEKFEEAKSYTDEKIGEIDTPTIPSNVSAFNNDIGYLTEHQSLDGYATENWVEDKGYLTEHQSLKTINNESIIGSGNIEIQGGGSVIGKSGTGEGSEIFNGYEGDEENFASGIYSHAEGSHNFVSSDFSHVEGNNNNVSGLAAHAEGYNTFCYGTYGHTEGQATTANDWCSHAEGYNTYASGECSHAEGRETSAQGNYSHAEGISNVGYINAIHEVGIGEEDGQNRKNAHTITLDGKHYIKGIGGYNNGNEQLDRCKDLATVISEILTHLGI